MKRLGRKFSALFLIVGSLSAACGSSGSAEEAAAPAPGADPGTSPPAPGADAAPPAPPKAPSVTGTPDDSEINEMLGIFVAPSGAANGDGSRAHPLATVQSGIDRARLVGKRVYVCTGIYKEALVLADSISVIAGLDCSAPIWKNGAARSRIEAPTSPAILAKDITSPTRLEGLDIVAPDATAAGASSIGVLADHAAAITLAKSSVKAGDAASGADGVEGIALTLDEALATGRDAPPDAKCVNFETCNGNIKIGTTHFYWYEAPGAFGGTSVCAGAPNHNGQSGGKGGNSGLYEALMTVTFPTTRYWGPYSGQGFSGIAPRAGEVRSTLPAPAGQSGTNGGALGSLTAEGYVGIAGTAGTDGTAGYGGSGGWGAAVDPALAAMASTGDIWRGKGGPGGGAGGCPGLAGTPGGGGGASIALALIESPLVVDATQLTAGNGGAGGHGTFGSDATAGGSAGLNRAGDPFYGAGNGGRGGSAGTSANGSSGPSVGMMHVGAPATLVNGGRATAGTGGADLPETSKTDDGGTRVIAATPAGLSTDILASQ